MVSGRAEINIEVTFYIKDFLSSSRYGCQAAILHPAYNLTAGRVVGRCAIGKDASYRSQL